MLSLYTLYNRLKIFEHLRSQDKVIKADKLSWLKQVDINQLVSQGPDTPFHCRLFQKVDQWMNKDEQLDNDAKKRLEDANQVSSFTSADISVQTVRTRSCFLIVE